MAANRLARALTKLHDTITKSAVVDVLGPFRLYSDLPRPKITAVLQCFAALSAATSQFGDAERGVLVALDIATLADPDWWARVISAISRSSIPDELASEVTELCARLQVVINGFPVLARLAEASTTAPLEQQGLALTLPGRGGEPPTLGRVAATIEAVNQLWSAAEELTGHRATLRLAGTEPGPTMTLYFDGQAEPLAELLDLLASVWEQVARLPGIPAEQHAALVPEMLPVMDRIGRSGRSDALRVRGAVEAGVRRLLEAGCSMLGRPAPPEAPVGRVSPTRPVMVPAATFQTSPDPHATPALSGEDLTHLANVIAEERRQLPRPEQARRLWQGAASSSTG